MKNIISGNDFVNLVRSYFNFLVQDFDYKEVSQTKRNGLFYDVQYKKANVVISISFENREDYLQVILFKLQNGIRPDYDDREATIHLDKLNEIVFIHLTHEDFSKNDSFFSLISPSNKLEHKLLKSAKELRLCMLNLIDKQWP